MAQQDVLRRGSPDASGATQGHPAPPVDLATDPRNGSAPVDGPGGPAATTEPTSDVGEAAPDGIVWEPLPPVGVRLQRQCYHDLLVALMQRPGDWARLRTFKHGHQASNACTQLKRGFYRVPSGRFEFARRSVDDGFALYARYLGPDNGSTE